MPLDKRHVYDFDTRIPLLVRGPGIVPGSILSSQATPVDLAPTFLAIAGESVGGRTLWSVRVRTARRVC